MCGNGTEMALKNLMKLVYRKKANAAAASTKKKKKRSSQPAPRPRTANNVARNLRYNANLRRLHAMGLPQRKQKQQHFGVRKPLTFIDTGHNLIWY